MIAFQSVTQEYAGHPALRHFSFDFPEGQTTAIIGPSGCGKSTLLRLILGLIQPTAGEIQFDGVWVNPATVGMIRRSVGYVIQQGGLFPHLTAQKNVTLLARYLKWPEEEIQSRLNTLLQLTHLSREVLNRYPSELSGGQRQRVGLMRALMLNPKALLLDEPLGALDPMVRAELQTDLKEIFRQFGHTVLLVTHDMGEAAYLGDQIVLMREGSIVQTGTLEDFKDRPVNAFVTQFLNAQRCLVSL